MRILIVGGGKMGLSLCENLSKEGHAVTLIDKNPDVLRRAGDTLDILCVRGNGIQASLLREAGVRGVDVFISTASTDEINMVCCLTAKKLGAAFTVARIRDPETARDAGLFKKELDLGAVINPEQAVAGEIYRILRYSGVAEIETLGKIELCGFVAKEGDPFLRTPLHVLRKHTPLLFCAARQGERVLIPDGDTFFLPGDFVYLAGEHASLASFFKEHGRDTSRIRTAMIVGGGRIGCYLTEILAKAGVRVKVIERDRAACENLSESSTGAVTVIHADGTDIDILEGEDIAETDAFISLTNRDEDNLMIALAALAAGVKRVVAKSNRENYIPLVKTLGLEAVVNPKNITETEIIQIVRTLQNAASHAQSAVTLHRLFDDSIEVVEFVVPADAKILGKPLSALKLKKRVLVASVVRGSKVLLPDGNTVLKEGDHVVLVCQEVSATNLDAVVN